MRDVPPKYGNWNTIYRWFLHWSEIGLWETVSVTLIEIMADSGHYSVYNTSVRAQVWAADMDCDSDAIRTSLAGRDIQAVIPGRSKRKMKIKYDRTLNSTIKSNASSSA